MIKIELVKFEAQDVITASICDPMEHSYVQVGEGYTSDGTLYHDIECTKCGDKQSVVPTVVPEV